MSEQKEITKDLLFAVDVVRAVEKVTEGPGLISEIGTAIGLISEFSSLKPDTAALKASWEVLKADPASLNASLDAVIKAKALPDHPAAEAMVEKGIKVLEILDNSASQIIVVLKG